MQSRHLVRCLVVIAVAELLLFSTGCSGFLQQYNLYSTGIQVPGNKPLQKLEGKVCVLRARVKTGHEGYQNMVSAALAGALYELKGESQNDLEIIPFSKFVNLVNERGMVEEYLAMSRTYDRGGLMPRDGLRMFRDELGIDYFIKPTLLQLEQRSDKRLSVFSFRLIVTKETTSELSAEIWETRNGRKVWENGCGISMAGESIKETRISPEEVTRRVCRALFQDIVSPKVESDAAGTAQGE